MHGVGGEHGRQVVELCTGGVAGEPAEAKIRERVVVPERGLEAAFGVDEAGNGGSELLQLGQGDHEVTAGEGTPAVNVGAGTAGVDWGDSREFRSRRR